MSQNVCKKCGRPLPSSYTGKLCLHCKSEEHDKHAKAIAKIAGGLAIGAGSIIAAIVGSKKKKK